MPSRGDVWSTITVLAANGTLNIQPDAGVEATIHNFYYEGNVEIYFTNGSNPICIHKATISPGDLQGFWHVTHTHYFMMVDTTGVGNTVGFDGVYVKVS